MVSPQENEPALSGQEHLPLPKVYRRWTYVLIIDILQWISICLLGLIFIYYPMFMLAPLFGGSRPPEIADAIWFGLGMLCVWGEIASIVSLFRTLCQRLVLTDRGIIRYGISEYQFTPWSNIFGVGANAKGKGLRLKELCTCENLAEGLEKNVPTLVVSKRRWFIRDLYAGFFPIPQDISERDWENGLLGKYLRRYSCLNMDECAKEEADLDTFLALMARKGSFLERYVAKRARMR